MGRPRIHGIYTNRRQRRHYEENPNECRVVNCSNEIVDRNNNLYCEEHQ